MFWVEILLSSCSLVGLYVNLQVKVTGKEKWKFSKCFSGGCLKLRLRFAKTGKVGWASCCETWLGFEIEALRCRKKKVKVFLKKNVRVVGYPVSWAPCCE